jgi:uncharacterized membrane protein YesL
MMRAFSVTWRACVSFYNELFFLVGTNLLWWITGGIFVGAAVVLGWPLLQVNGPWWLAPVLAIPAGPATAALAYAMRQVARDLHVDRGFLWEGFRLYWRKALGLNAISMAVLSMLFLNLLFYISQRNTLLQALTFLWLYLIVFWFSVQLYLFPILVGMEQPSVLGALRMAAILAFANPLFSILLCVIAILLTGLSVALAILLLLAWPAVMTLLGEHSLMLFMERLGGKRAG